LNERRPVARPIPKSIFFIIQFLSLRFDKADTSLFFHAKITK
jgi:hypothetical protein